MKTILRTNPAFIGYTSANDFALVVAPWENACDPALGGIDLEGAQIYTGRDGDLLLPQPMDFEASDGSQSLSTIDITFSRTLTAPGAPIQYTWRDTGAETYHLRPLEPGHFWLQQGDGGVRIRSRPRHIHYFGGTSNGSDLLVVITTVYGAGVSSAEFFSGSRQDGVGKRSLVAGVTEDPEVKGAFSLSTQMQEFILTDNRRLRRNLILNQWSQSGIPLSHEYASFGALRLARLNPEHLLGLDQRDGEVYFR